MLFAGLQKLTLLDYPGHTACTVFTQGCDFRCPFCHNSSLLETGVTPENPVREEEILSFLMKRRGTLDGVAVTGGEPLLHPELWDFILRVRRMGFKVKLDTNGNRPEYLRRLIDGGMVDMVAMDIKNCPAHYARTVGLPGIDLGPIRESVSLLMEGRTPYEFRTTVTAQLHSEEDMRGIGEWLRGDSPYFLQSYVDSGHVLRPGLTAPSPEKMREYRELLLPYLPLAQTRGLD
ncbi:MAG: anaerobic ribonucleoside-triphosphate reductase activating protein [Clostridia bacterium]|nr:anaerobic ribonucleoside-triphosphate reductase activating protein [Clostridia bacterium]